MNRKTLKTVFFSFFAVSVLKLLITQPLSISLEGSSYRELNVTLIKIKGVFETTTMLHEV